MKKGIWIVAAALLCALSLAGCGQSAEEVGNTPVVVSDAGESGQGEDAAFVCDYTNLAGEASREKVDALLQQAGISAERRAVFWDHVDQFNDSVEGSVLQGDFAEGNLLSPSYDPYALQEQWAEKHPDFEGYNCRITAFSLLSDQIESSSEGEIREDQLFLDKESLTEDPSALLQDGDLESFLRLFSTIPTEDTTDPSVHAEKVQSDWNQRGITFRENDRASLITVWFHDRWSETENELFVGHTGVLLTGEDGLYFVEKLAFQEPYVVIRLDSRQQLADYLMKKYDTSWGQDTARPFIMENDQLMV